MQVSLFFAIVPTIFPNVLLMFLQKKYIFVKNLLVLCKNYPKWNCFKCSFINVHTWINIYEHSHINVDELTDINVHT